ncbi:unnamed protein product, partial [Hymenolepis diminuta]
VLIKNTLKNFCLLPVIPAFNEERSNIVCSSKYELSAGDEQSERKTLRNLK